MKKALTKVKTKYLIIGVGKFGYGFVDRLLQEGVDEKSIYLVDENELTIEQLNSKGFSNITNNKVTNIQLLENTFPLNEIDIVLIGTSDFKDSIELAYSLSTCTYEFKKVYAKASSFMHKKFLRTLALNKNVLEFQKLKVEEEWLSNHSMITKLKLWTLEQILQLLI